MAPNESAATSTAARAAQPARNSRASTSSGSDGAPSITTSATDRLRSSSRRVCARTPAGAGGRAQTRRLLDRSRSVADVVIEGAPSGPLDVNAREFLAGCAARAAVLVAADSLGAMARMLDLAVTYSKQRHQFGVPTGSFQAANRAAATILVEVEAACLTAWNEPIGTPN